MQDSINPFEAPKSDLPAAVPSALAGQLAAAARGLGIVLASIGVSFGGMLVAIGMSGADGLAALGMKIYAASVLASLAMFLVGVGYCLNVPAAARARGLGFGSLAGGLAGFSASIGGRIASIPALSLGSIVALFAALVLFVLYLRQLARFMGDQKYARRAENILIAVTLMICGMVYARAAELAPIWHALLTLCVIPLVLVYAHLIFHLRTAILNGQVAPTSPQTPAST